MPASGLAVSNHVQALANSSTEKCGACSLHFRSPTRLAECDAEEVDAFRRSSRRAGAQHRRAAPQIILACGPVVAERLNEGGTPNVTIGRRRPLMRAAAVGG